MRSKRSTILRIELLEDRCTPTTWGNPWPDPTHLTLSFVPDGTQIGNQSSDLFQTMNALAPTSIWEMTILQSFQTWAAAAKIDLTVVPDSGLPLGTAGTIQGDARFGDIRIAAYPMAAGAEAESTPFELDAGTWSGDVCFNSAASFSVNGGPGQYDLATVALHEAGHVFGFDVNSNPASVMYSQYLGVRTTLGASDLAAIQALYGVPADAGGNDSMQTAIHLNPIANGNGSLAITTSGNLASLQDHDFYAFNSLLNLGAVTVTLQTADISLLTPSVTVFGPWGQTIVNAVDTNPEQGGLVIHLANVFPLSTYYIEVQSGQQNVFGVGNYQLTIAELPLVSNLLAPVTDTVTQSVTAVSAGLLNAFHTNTTFATATPLPLFGDGANGSYYGSTRGSLEGAGDADYYAVQAPTGSGGEPFTALVWGLQDQIDPQVLVFNGQHQVLAAQVILNDGYSFAVEVPTTTPGATYYVEVVPGAGGAGGNYGLCANFTPNAVVLQNQVSGTLSNALPVALNTLDTSATDRSNLYHFVLSADAGVNASVRMTITNSAGQVIFTLSAGTNEAVSGDVLLAPGVYYVAFAGATNGPIPAMSFQLLGDILTAPIGPESTNPGGDPGGGSGTGGDDQPTWDDGSTTGVAPQEPGSGPYAATVTLQNPTDQTNLAGDVVNLALSASDSTGDPLTYSATGLPPGLSVDPNSGLISGAIDDGAANGNSYVVTVTATDANANTSATQSFYWTVNPPILTVSSPGDQANSVGDNVSFIISASCTDGAALNFSAANLPPGLAIDPNSGAVSGTVSQGADAGSPYAVVVTVTDPNSGVSASLNFNWTVS